MAIKPLNNIVDWTPSGTITNGLLARYRFENDLSDETGTYNLSATTAPTYTTGKEGSYAADWTGTSASTAFHDFANSDPLSVCLWVLDSSTSTNSFDDDRWTGLDGDTDAMTLQPDGSGAASIATSGANTTGMGTTNIVDGAWHHVCFTFDQNADHLICYVDGVKEYEDTAYTDNIEGMTNTTLYVGSFSTNDYDGLVDDLRYYNRILTASEVSDIAALNG